METGDREENFEGENGDRESRRGPTGRIAEREGEVYRDEGRGINSRWRDFFLVGSSRLLAKFVTNSGRGFACLL